MSMLRKYLPWASLALCAALLVLMLIDLISPKLYIFLHPFGKIFALIACLAAAANGILLISRQRAAIRRSQQRPRRRG